MPAITLTPMKPLYGFQNCQIVHSVSVYQSAVPLRAVEVCRHEHDMTEVTEVAVVGIQLTIQIEYNRKRNHASDERCEPATSKEAIENGWEFDARYCCHEVLLWSTEFSNPCLLSDFGCSNCEILVAPTSDTNWDINIEAAKKELKRRELAKSAIPTVPAQPTSV